MKSFRSNNISFRSNNMSSTPIKYRAAPIKYRSFREINRSTRERNRPTQERNRLIGTRKDAGTVNYDCTYSEVAQLPDHSTNDDGNGSPGVTGDNGLNVNTNHISPIGTRKFSRRREPKRRQCGVGRAVSNNRPYPKQATRRPEPSLWPTPAAKAAQLQWHVCRQFDGLECDRLILLGSSMGFVCCNPSCPAHQAFSSTIQF